MQFNLLIGNTGISVWYSNVAGLGLCLDRGTNVLASADSLALLLLHLRPFHRSPQNVIHKAVSLLLLLL